MFEELLASLDEAGVRFVVVGGLAVVIQGFARLTADVDLVIELDSVTSIEDPIIKQSAGQPRIGLILNGCRRSSDSDVTSEPEINDVPTSESWRGDFRAAEERSLESSLAATASQRLAWLEEALQFAARTGAFPPPLSREHNAPQ